jgi:death on curing protein
MVPQANELEIVLCVTSHKVGVWCLFGGRSPPNKHHFPPFIEMILLCRTYFFLHSRLIQETGGAHGVRDLPMLLSAAGRPQSTFNGSEPYANIFAKAAALLDSLIRNNPFVGGNKPTAIAAAGLFFRLKGCRLAVENEEMVRFTLVCAQSQVRFEELTARCKSTLYPIEDMGQASFP